MLNENIALPVRKLGRPLKYTPEQLHKKFQEYCKWAADHPIRLKTRVDSVAANGAEYGNTTIEEKPRLISIGGFLVFLGATRSWWGELDRSEVDFSAVKELIREFCEDYQKEMASGNLFNANIISRLLGLADRQQVEAKVDAYNFKFGDAK